jgi:hypothetical protein
MMQEGVMKLLLIMIVHDSFCEGIRVLSPTYQMKSEQMSMWGVHHKTGTRLSRLLSDDLASNTDLGRVSKYQASEICADEANADYDVETCSWRQNSISQHSLFWGVDRAAYEKLQKDSNGSYKLVHAIRDPVSLVVSAYHYHLEHFDTSIVPDTGPDVLRGLSLEEGLVHEAKMEYASTLKAMMHMLEASRNDPNVLTISLEDFAKDFDGTVAAVYQHFLGKDHPQLTSLCEKARFYDLTRRPESGGDHVTTSQFHKEAMSIIQNSSDPIWSDLRSLRTALHYDFPDLDGKGRITPDAESSLWDILSHYE